MDYSHRRRLKLYAHVEAKGLEADPELGPHDIYDMIESDLNRRRITKLSVNVTQVTLAFEFEPVDGRKPGSMSFDVSYPDSCSLRNQRPERLEMALKYLKRWNIDVTKSPAARS
jgi:hypothetical protein